MENIEELKNAVNEYHDSIKITEIKRKRVQKMLFDIAKKKYEGKIIINKLGMHNQLPSQAFVITSIDKTAYDLHAGDTDLLLSCTVNLIRFHKNDNGKWYADAIYCLTDKKIRVSIDDCELVYDEIVTYHDLNTLFDLFGKDSQGNDIGLGDTVTWLQNGQKMEGIIAGKYQYCDQFIIDNDYKQYIKQAEFLTIKLNNFMQMSYNL